MNQFTAIADRAVWALIEEAELTPKPALVDRRGSGAHRDLTLPLMCRSAQALHETFAAIARCSLGQTPSQQLREKLGAIGRQGELRMLDATHGSNSHRGAIWGLGLLVAGTMMARRRTTAEIATRAARLARHAERFAPVKASNGSAACARYSVSGARGEAMAGFPHVLRIGLPALRLGRTRGLPEPAARLDALLAIMACLDDTCLLHRGGRAALALAQAEASRVVNLGGLGTAAGKNALMRLETKLLRCHASPGGAADLLTATLFLDSICSRP